MERRISDDENTRRTVRQITKEKGWKERIASDEKKEKKYPKSLRSRRVERSKHNGERR